MTILCGIDFSENSLAVARAAGAIAARMSVPLTLVHAVDPTADGQASVLLKALAQKLQSQLGVHVETLVECGAADEILVELADRLQARLIAVAPRGDRAQQRWLLGSVAERVAQASAAPVLVVRDADSLEGWARGDRTLRVMVGVELSVGGSIALRWAQGLRRIGPCDLIISRIIWPAEEQQRAGIPSPIPLDSLDPQLERRLLRALRQWAGDVPGPGDNSFVVRPGWGRVDSHLSQLAEQLGSEMLVVGTHQRAALARLWQGSVSRGVLHRASMNVACVPGGGEAGALAQGRTTSGAHSSSALH